MPDLVKLRAIVDSLADLSNNGRIPWTETADDRTFQATLKDYTVSLAEKDSTTYGGEADYRIAIYDLKGRMLDEAIDTDFQGLFFANGDRPYVALKNVYDQARRKALSVDQALDDLLGSLNELRV